MDKPIYAFFISLFHVFLVYIVFANFLGWSGGAINVTGYSYSWEYTYVGFQSVLMAIEDFKVGIQSVRIADHSVFAVDNLWEYLNQLLKVTTFGIPDLITKIANGYNFNAFDIVQLFITILFQPLLFGLWATMCIAFVIYWIVVALGIFFKFCGGAYNIPFQDTREIWSQWSYLESEWDWSSLSWDWSSLQAHVQ